MSIWFKSIQTLSVVISATMLIACSSGTSHINTTAPVIHQPDSNGNSAGTGNIAGKNDAIKGHQLLLNHHGKIVSNHNTSSAPAIALVEIDGKTISFDLVNANIDATINKQSDSETRIGAGKAFQHLRFGYIKNGQNGTPALFSQGIISQDMPTQGMARYEGFATHINQGEPTIKNASFTVNYSDKHIIGTVGDIDIGGTITGNQFGGKRSNGFSTQGYFYGNQAIELGGTYQNDTGDISGAFGAKRGEIQNIQ